MPGYTFDQHSLIGGNSLALYVTCQSSWIRRSCISFIIIISAKAQAVSYVVFIFSHVSYTTVLASGFNWYTTSRLFPSVPSHPTSKMKFHSLLLSLACASSTFAFLPGISMWEAKDNLEAILTGDVLNFFVEPCASFTTGPRIQGEQTAAEWVRIVFHDMITHNKAAGTGWVLRTRNLKWLSPNPSRNSGLDGSIAFESDRAENIGAHFINDTINVVSCYVQCS